MQFIIIKNKEGKSVAVISSDKFLFLERGTHNELGEGLFYSVVGRDSINFVMGGTSTIITRGFNNGVDNHLVLL